MAACVAGSVVLTMAGGALVWLRYLSTIAGLLLAGVAATIFGFAFLGHYHSVPAAFFALQLPAFALLVVLPSGWFFVSLAAAAYSVKNHVVEETIGFGMLACFLGACSAPFGGALIGAIPIVVLVIGIIILAGADALLRQALPDAVDGGD